MPKVTVKPKKAEQDYVMVPREWLNKLDRFLEDLADLRLLQERRKEKTVSEETMKRRLKKYGIV